MCKKSTIKWEDATAMPIKDWSNAGSINKIYPPLLELLKRLQKAYHAANGGKRPNLAQTCTYALCLASFVIERKCKDLERIVENREAAAEAMAVEVDPNSLISKDVV